MFLLETVKGQDKQGVSFGPDNKTTHLTQQSGLSVVLLF